jgi:hypothetical protein
MKEVFGNSAEHFKPVKQELVDNFIFDNRLARSYLLFKNLVY